MVELVGSKLMPFDTKHSKLVDRSHQHASIEESFGFWQLVVLVVQVLLELVVELVQLPFGFYEKPIDPYQSCSCANTFGKGHLVGLVGKRQDHLGDHSMVVPFH